MLALMLAAVVVQEEARALLERAVHALDRDASKVEKARAAVRARGLSGLVAVDRLTGDRLPYIDRMVNLVVAEDLSGVAMEEVERVLAPRGTALVKKAGAWTKTVKPVPSSIDDWTHYLHDAGGAGRRRSSRGGRWRPRSRSRT
jgi:hypothetical protein